MESTGADAGGTGADADAGARGRGFEGEGDSISISTVSSLLLEGAVIVSVVCVAADVDIDEDGALGPIVLILELVVLLGKKGGGSDALTSNSTSIVSSTGALLNDAVDDGSLEFSGCDGSIPPASSSSKWKVRKARAMERDSTGVRVKGRIHKVTTKCQSS